MNEQTNRSLQNLSKKIKIILLKLTLNSVLKCWSTIKTCEMILVKKIVPKCLVKLVQIKGIIKNLVKTALCLKISRKAN